MRIFKPNPSVYEKMYQQKYREIYSRARMKEMMMAAKRDALMAARTDTQKMKAMEQPRLKGILKSAQAAAAQFAENVEEANRRAGIGRPVRAYGKYAYQRRNEKC